MDPALLGCGVYKCLLGLCQFGKLVNVLSVFYIVNLDHTQEFALEAVLEDFGQPHCGLGMEVSELLGSRGNLLSQMFREANSLRHR